MRWKKSRVQYLHFTSFTLYSKKKTLNNSISYKKVNESEILSNNSFKYSTKILKNLTDKEEINACEFIYKKDNQNVPKLIQKLQKFLDCSFWLYGVNQSYERIKYGYCKTCDKNLINPICEFCLFNCHRKHCIKTIVERGNIKCTCGEKNHKVENKDDVKIECSCHEWSYVSNMKYYYRTKDKKNLCIFCHNVCNFNRQDDALTIMKNTIKNGISNENNDYFPVCDCVKEDVHGDAKSFLEHLIKYFNYQNEIKKVLHPTQIINMIFKSTNNFNYLFFQLKDFIEQARQCSNTYFENFFLMDIKCTSIYYSLKLLSNLINKSNLPYYCDKIEDFFSFNIYKEILSSLKKSNVDERSYWIFCRDYSYILYKLYINKRTKHLLKLKIYDLENLSYIQRLNLFNKNSHHKEFKECEKITSFLISQIRNNIDVYQYNSIESIQCIKNFLLIFHKFSSYNFLKIKDMINICIRIEVIFNFINLVRKSTFKKNITELINLELNVLNIIIKMMLIFVYNYNDEIITEILFNKEKFPNINSVTNDKIKLLLKKNKLGNLINKISIRVMSILLKYYKGKQGTNIYKQTLLNIMKILEFSLTSDDNYMKNILMSLEYLKDNDCSYLFTEQTNNEHYDNLLKESENIEKAYFNYLNFIITEKELIDLMNKSLSPILNEIFSKFDSDVEINLDVINVSFSKEQNIAIIRTQYFYKISKLFNIVFNENNIENNTFKMLHEKKKVVQKILVFYFIFANSSSDNSILILSSYLLKEITNLPSEYNLTVFKLLYKCFRNISSSFKMIINIRYIIDIIYYFFEKNFIKIKESQNENECILIFFNIIKILIYEMKIYLSDNSFLTYIKNIIYNINKECHLSEKYFQYKKQQPLVQMGTSADNSKITENKIDTIFLIMINIINDIFDFSLENEREMIYDMINIDNIIEALLTFTLKISERTEYIRFLRKMLVDINYCEKKEDYYTSFIINKKDNLAFINYNALVNNLTFPTKLFSFKKEFYNLSKLVVLKEKLRKKNKNKSDKISKNESKIGSSELTIGNRCTNRIHQSQYPINAKGERVCPLNEKTNFTKFCQKCNYYIGTEKNYSYYRDSKSIKHPTSKLGNVLKKKTKGAPKKSVILFSHINNMYQNRHNSIDFPKSKFGLSDKLVNSFREKEVKTLKIRKIKEKLKIQTGKNEKLVKRIPGKWLSNKQINFEEGTLFPKQNMNQSLEKNENEKVESDSYEESDGNDDYTNRRKSIISKSTSVLNKDKDIFYYSFFDYQFYKIIKYELENYYYYTNELSINNKNNIIELKNYFENGLLIPIVYFFKRVFLYINQYSGKQVMRIYEIIEKSLNLKIYISSYNYDFWEESEDNQNINKENYKDKTKNESNINGFYFKDEKYKNETLNSLKELKNKHYSPFDYTFLFQIVEKEFFTIIKYKKNLKVFESFSSKRKEPNIIIGDEYYFHTLILSLIQKEEKKIENYEQKTDIEKKFLRVYYIFKYCKNYFLRTIDELSIFNIFSEICVEFQKNYMSLLLSFLIESEQNNFIDIYNFKYYLLYILLLYKPGEIQSKIIELLGGMNTRDLGFIRPLSQKLFKKLILSVIDYFNPSDKILYSHYFVTYNLITVFKYLCAQYNSFFQHHLVKSLSFNYKEAIPDKYMIKKVKKDKLSFSGFINNYKQNNEKSLSSSDLNSNSSSSHNGEDYVVIDYLTDEDNKSSSSRIKIDFFDFFLCFLLKILLISDSNEVRYGLLIKQNLYLYDLFHTILDMLIVIIQGNKLITIKNLKSKKTLNIFNMRKKKNNSNSSSSILCNQHFVEIKETFQMFLENALLIIFGDKMDNDLLLGIKFKLLLFIMAILEEKNCNPEIQSFIIRKLRVDKIIEDIGTVLKEYYLNLKEFKDEIIKEGKEKSTYISKEYTANFRDHRDVDEIEKEKDERNNKAFVKMLRKTKSLNNKTTATTTFDFLDNSKGPLKKQLGNKSVIYKKLNQNKCRKEETVTSSLHIMNGNEQYNQPKLKQFCTKVTIVRNKTTLLLKMDDSDYNLKVIKKEYNREIKNLFFNDKLCDFFHNKYFDNTNNNSRNFINNELFQFANLLYRCIKKMAVQKQKKEAVKIIKRVEVALIEYKKISKRSYISLNQYIKDNVYTNKLEFEQINLSDDKKKKLKKDLKQNENEGINNINEKPIKEEENDPNEKKFMEQFYIIKFFESIISTVEIRTKEGIPHIAIFTKVPEFKYLSEDSKKHFLGKANRKNEKTKKNDLLMNIDYFIGEINHYKNNKNPLVHWFSKIQFSYFLRFSYLYALIFNLFLLFTLEGDKQITDKYSKEKRRKDIETINFLQNESMNKYEKYYKSLSICYIFVNIFLIFLWVYFRLPLYYKLDKVRFKSGMRIKQKLKFINKLYIIFFMTLIERNYILILLYELVIAIFASVFKSKIFVVFTLLSVVFLSETLYNLVTIIKSNRDSLFLLLLLASFVMYSLSNYSYFFYKSDYEQELDYNNDNVCETLTFCFLNAADYGLRARGGIGDSGIKVSFSRNIRHYIGRILIDVSFFLLIIIVMIDLLFGIIIQSFLILKNKNHKLKMNEKTSCFICNVNVETLARFHSHSLKVHKEYIHDMWNYVEYIISLKRRDTNFLNFIDTYVKNQIEKKYIGWMPTYSDFIKKYKNKGDDEGDEETILEETKNKKLRT